MALSGEIATLFVRLRPNMAGFGAAVTEGVKAALVDVQTQTAEYARAQAEETAGMVRANLDVAASYKEIGAAAAEGSVEQRTAYGLAVKAAESAAALMVNASDEAIKGTLAEIDANRKLALSFPEGADAAKVAALQEIGAVQRVAVASDEAASKSRGGWSKAGAGAGSGFVSGLKSHLLNLGTLFGVGIGADIAVRFVKDVTAGAASVQKSAEVIKSEFGNSASQVLVKFGDTAAAKLGISAQLADSTSARFGILFKNLGLGQPVAANMTVGFEQLAGALSAMKGVDPSTVMQSIVLAAAGNTRGLKQLGISVDATSEKVAAFKLGLISSVSEALTPGVKAQAIYALATANLGNDLKQAAAHSGDYASVQHRLSAEWANAKDIVGTALLPTFQKYTGELANWLGRMNSSGQLQKDFNSALQTSKGIFETVRSAIEDVVGPSSRL